MIEQRIKLDLSKVSLYGWEGLKSRFVADAYATRVEQGDMFPPVWVYMIDDQTYQLTKLWKPDNSGLEGGHTRAIAHYTIGTPLECIVKGNKSEIDLGEHGPILIREIKLATGEHALRAFRELQKRDERYKL